MSEQPPVRYTNNELALLIQALDKTIADGLAAVQANQVAIQTSMHSFLLREVYEADQSTRADKFSSLEVSVDGARRLAMWCVGLIVALIGAVATLAGAVVVTR